MSRIVEWNPGVVASEFRKVFKRRLAKVLADLTVEAERKVSRGQPRITTESGVLGLDPSDPGEPPKVVTGTLKANISFEVREGFGYVSGFLGVLKGQAPYAKYLEFGTKKMEPRPFLRPTIIENAKKIMRGLSD